MSFHVIIAEERRVSTPENPRPLAYPMSNDLVTQTGVDKDGFPILQVTKRPPQLHSMGERVDNLSDANILYAAEWDGKAPYVNLLKGKIEDLRLAYSGWPMVDKAEWDADNPSV